MTAFPKPRPKLLEQRKARAALAAQDRRERMKCRLRSGGQCEVRVRVDIFQGGFFVRRCERQASQNHHLIGGSGRRNKGRSILAAHRLDVCDQCHQNITRHILGPAVSKADAEWARLVRFTRVT